MTKLRTSIRHFHQVKPTELHDWLDDDGRLCCEVTEKTDGMAFAVGWDPEHLSFYSRTAHSPRTYNAWEYLHRAKARFGDNLVPSISQGFIDTHELLENHEPLVDFLRQNQCEISGEAFLRYNGEINEDGMIKFVGTWYDANIISKPLTFVIHTKMNEILPDTETWRELNVFIDDDAVEQIQPPQIDPSDSEQAEQIVRNWLDNIPGKWGPNVEGYVLHHETHSPIKIMNPDFYTNKRTF